MPSSRRIAVFKRRSEYCPCRIVQLSNGSPPKPWNDIFYDYFLRYYSANQPPKEVFDLQNEPVNENSTYHVYIKRGGSTGDHRQGMTLTSYEEQYIAEIYVRKNEIGELFPELENIYNEVKRIFIEEYESYGIAGIRLIDNMRASGALPPEVQKNPVSHRWLIEVVFTVYYSVKTLLMPEKDSTQIKGHKYSAGTIRKDFG